MMHSHARCGACVRRDKTDVLFLTNRAMIHRRHGQVCYQVSLSFTYTAVRPCHYSAD